MTPATRAHLRVLIDNDPTIESPARTTLASLIETGTISSLPLDPPMLLTKSAAAEWLGVTRGVFYKLLDQAAREGVSNRFLVPLGNRTRVSKLALAELVTGKLVLTWTR